jgi:hypothetical protein
MSLQCQKGPDNVLFDLSTKMNILECKFNDLLEELNTTKDQIKDIYTKLITIPTLSILAQDVIVRGGTINTTLPEDLTNIRTTIRSVIHNLERLKVAIAILVIVPTNWRQSY